jgi:hypothetical protein
MCSELDRFSNLGLTQIFNQFRVSPCGGRQKKQTLGLGLSEGLLVSTVCVRLPQASLADT